MYFKDSKSILLSTYDLENRYRAPCEVIAPGVARDEAGRRYYLLSAECGSWAESSARGHRYWWRMAWARYGRPFTMCGG